MALPNLAKALLGQPYGQLTSGEQKVIASIAENTPVAEDTNEIYEESLTVGQIVSDKIAAFGGAWSFIGLFFGFILGWIAISVYRPIG